MRHRATSYHIAAAGDRLGESPFWSKAQQALFWVDMLGRRVRRLQWVSGRVDTWSVGDFPTAIALRCEGGAILALTGAVGFFDLDKRFETIAVPEPLRSDQRLNEGRCDPRGRFWVASMTTNLKADGTVVPVSKRSGSLYCIEVDRSIRRVCQDVFGIPNTMIWMPDGRFLIADSMSAEIYAYDYLADANQIVDRRPFSTASVCGVPDGSALDCEGGIWNARFGGGCVVRFSASGEVDQVIDLPSLNPTSCTFGGPDLDTLYVTTASAGLSSGQVADSTAQGALLAIEPGVKGVGDVLFAG